MTHRYLPVLAARAVPRYTSYPTAAEFGPMVGAEDQAAALDAIAPGAPVSLYLHIPYCEQICWYCGCNTGAVGRPQRLDVYRAAIEAEIATVSARMRGQVTAVHFGGGSPNALSPEAFAEICGTLRQRFDIAPDAQWAAEIDPRFFGRAHAYAFARSGIGRISVGAQSFAPLVQAAIGRIQPFAKVASAIAEARNAGIGQINLDLMYGLPGQTLDDIAATVAAARRLAPDRVAMFGYAHLPAMLPRQRQIDASKLPGAEARFWQRALAHDLWIEAGYDAIGFDHFARPDDSLAVAVQAGALRRNFQGFTDDRAPTLIGLGASAISQFGGVIVQNEKHVGRYRMAVLGGELAGVRGVRRAAHDVAAGDVIERLLCDGHVDVAAIAAAHGMTAEQLCHDAALLDELAGQGVIGRDGWSIGVTAAGAPYARIAAAAFDRYRVVSRGQFSAAV
ncbi:MAG: oxygen-independent coproporphyrinogen III oxidase [Sphingomonas sp.]|uniref:oxygen-independent coproporphyrinogen III oxidase n=1 Tax=Sphingomonas sp. TaxID=28214 RepID=UPI0026207C93|nr:oxygen-independent coproporphyrinogen III oxidase [Sphingomonas sp.]MDK2767429.1 oxygen-independent coproporphyrinogen III oxidase [Sphingomonas sp.]